MKGNGKYKIPPIYQEYQIDYKDADVGDMIIEKVSGKWDRIKTIYKDVLRCETFYLTKHGNEYNMNDVIVVRY